MIQLLVVVVMQTSADLPAQQRQKSTDKETFHLVPYSKTARGAVEEAETPPAPDAVLTWNEAALQAIKAEKTPPPMAARNLAMVHAAVYDAVNSVQRTHKHYRTDAVPPASTSAEAAAAVAAHRVLLALYPKQEKALNALLKTSLLAVPEGDAKSEGVALGQFVAEKVLDWRGKDGSGRKADYEPPTGVGLWSPTPTGFKPALYPHWAQVECFALRSADQFRPKGPPALDSEAYAAAFAEVKKVGGADSAARTADQTEIALFWADGEGTVTPPGHWNRIAQGIAVAKGNSLADNARLFALLNIALADAGIACWDCKYKFNFWRPVQAVRAEDPKWLPLLETPPFPSYTSGHSTFSSAAATVLEKFYGTDEVRFSTTSEGTPGVTRSFTSFSSAAAEAGMSRIYGGIHWEFDNTEGLTCGRAVGEHVCGAVLLPRARAVSSR